MCSSSDLNQYHNSGRPTSWSPSTWSAYCYCHAEAIAQCHSQAGSCKGHIQPRCRKRPSARVFPRCVHLGAAVQQAAVHIIPSLHYDISIMIDRWCGKRGMWHHCVLENGITAGLAYTKRRHTPNSNITYRTGFHKTHVDVHIRPWLGKVGHNQGIVPQLL